MKNTYAIKRLALAMSLSLSVSTLTLATTDNQPSMERITIHSASEMPVVQLPIKALPSKLVLANGQNIADLNAAFAEHVAMLDSRFVLADKAAQRDFLKTKLLVSLRNSQWRDAIEQATQMQALEEKPAAKQVAGLLEQAYANAAINTGSPANDAFRAEYQKQLAQQLAQVDLTLARDALQSLLGFRKMMSANFIAGFIQARYDEQAGLGNMTLTAEAAQQLLSANRIVQQELAINDVIISTIENRLAQEPQVATENRWNARSIAIEEGQKTLVAIWDSGIDVSLQGDRMWSNPDPKAINPYGLAFGEDFSIEANNLMARMTPYADRVDEIQPLLKGFSDQRDNKITAEAKQLQAHLASLSPAQIGELQADLSEFVVFNHGQVVADIAATDINPVELMNIKISFPKEHKKSDIRVDEEYVEGFIKTVEQSVKFMQQHKARVVNMSWAYTLSEMEQGLLATGVETDAKKAKARAQIMFATFKKGLTNAFASAPEILFVAAAGNSDENVEFAQSAPAGINLPNLITVGAVDDKLEPTAFTSFGKSIDFYANGFRVPGRMPGGLELEATGTSMAAPLVTNLVAKMLAVEPGLTPPQIVALLQEHATLEGQQQLPVVHPAATVCALAPEMQACGADKIAKVN